MSREVAAAVEKVDWARVEEVMVTVKPWVRVDGTLNRKVLDRLLGAMLGVVMESPGQSLQTLLTRFSPAIQPGHSRDLVTILQQLGCVTAYKLEREARVSLFSRPTTPTLRPATLLDPDTELVVEAEVDAVVRFGMFIGEKQYSSDFASQCPCHPERRM